MDNIDSSLSLYSQIKPTNNDIKIEYLPAHNIQRYECKVFKNNENIENYVSDGNEEWMIELNTTGTYQIVISEIDIYGKRNVIESGLYNIDKEPPVIKLKNTLLTVKMGEKIDLFSNIKVTDNVTDDLKDRIQTNYSGLDLSTPGLKKLTYYVSDEAGNTASSSVNINLVRNINMGMIYIEFGVLVIFLMFIYLIMSLRKSIRLEKRVSQFSIKSAKGNTISIFDTIFNTYKKLINRLSSKINKSMIIKNYSKQFKKYLFLATDTYNNEIDFVSSKMIISIIFLLLNVLSKIVQYKTITIYSCTVSLIIGFFALDIIYYYRYRFYRSKIENDLLQAIIIMNNAFKSGRSITQSVELVANELRGPIASEFKKMSTELHFGLGLDVVFERFSERVNIEEVTYLTASLSILNKTGGNIIKVFSSIEKSLYGKKKLRLELKALIGSSKLIMYTLFFVPIAFVILISIINPTYFDAFFSNTFGIILLVFMVFYYVIYIIIVNRIMRVRM